MYKRDTTLVFPFSTKIKEYILFACMGTNSAHKITRITKVKLFFYSFFLLMSMHFFALYRTCMYTIWFSLLKRNAWHQNIQTHIKSAHFAQKFSIHFSMDNTRNSFLKLNYIITVHISFSFHLSLSRFLYLNLLHMPFICSHLI